MKLEIEIEEARNGFAVRFTAAGAGVPIKCDGEQVYVSDSFEVYGSKGVADRVEEVVQAFVDGTQR